MRQGLGLVLVDRHPATVVGRVGPDPDTDAHVICVVVFGAPEQGNGGVGQGAPVKRHPVVLAVPGRRASAKVGPTIVALVDGTTMPILHVHHVVVRVSSQVMGEGGGCGTRGHADPAADVVRRGVDPDADAHLCSEGILRTPVDGDGRIRQAAPVRTHAVVFHPTDVGPEVGPAVVALVDSAAVLILHIHHIVVRVSSQVVGQCLGLVLRQSNPATVVDRGAGEGRDQQSSVFSCPHRRRRGDSNAGCTARLVIHRRFWFLGQRHAGQGRNQHGQS